MPSSAKAEDFLETALGAMESGNGSRAVLDELPVPIYTTDAEGAVTYWNRACVAFAGREPQVGERWCVTWRLYTTDGDHLPHDQCPMAVAIREKRAIRGEIAIVGRPDGSRAAFTPYPTPLFDAEGNLTGAINMLIDISAEQACALADQADRCRRLSHATHDRQAAELLTAMASDYEETAASLKAK